jgi:hypothetical protein
VRAGQHLVRVFERIGVKTIGVALGHGAKLFRDARLEALIDGFADAEQMPEEV